MTAGMINFFTLGRHKFAEFLCRLSCVFFIIFIAGCSGGDSEPSSSETGTIAFNIALQNLQTTYLTALAMDGPSEDCQAAGVDTVRVELYDGADLYLTDGGPWPCSAHKGSLQNVPEGSDRKIVILCEDSDGNVRYRGEHPGITVTRGKTTHIGTVAAYSFIPTLSAPADGSNVTGEAVTLAWDAVEAADEYRITVSENADLSNPIVDDIIPETSFDLQDFSETATYYWQVHALDSIGNEGAVSAIGSFTVNAPPCMVTVPEAASCADITAVGLTCSGTEEYDEASAGTVLSQNPEAGTSVPCGSNVELVISLGPCMVDIPDVNVPDPKGAITAADLLIGTITYECSDTITAGHGISTIPAIGASVLCGSQVNLVISSGQPTVPNVIGTAKADAIAAVDAEDNLFIGTITYECSDTVTADNVISQNLDPGLAPCNTQVDLLISTGSCTIVVYVDQEYGSPDNSGRSWKEAKQTISQAIEAANEGDEIWVKQGTYWPCEEQFRIEISKSLSIYGGFDGTEKDRNNRDWENNTTTVDGGECKVRCFNVSAGATTVTIDGFTIIGGHAPSGETGGGVNNYNAASSLTITNCTFTNNTAVQGGGVNNYNENPSALLTVTNCRFNGNNATTLTGGGIFSRSASAIITGCTFENNRGASGGGLSCYYISSLTVTDCLFADNIAEDEYGGGFYNLESSPVVTNCKFYRNRGTLGGGINNYDSSTSVINCIFWQNTAILETEEYDDSGGGGICNYGGDTTITNCTFTRNGAYRGGAIYNKNSNVTMTNSILWYDSAEIYHEIYSLNSTTSVTYCDVYDGYEDGTIYTGTGNINENPNFFSEKSGDFHLRSNSPCIDKGSNNASELPGKDFEGDSRIIDGDNDGTETVDMGADEYFGYLFD